MEKNPAAAAGWLSRPAIRGMGGNPGHPPRCDNAAWVFLGLSMAGWNALISLKLAGWTIAWAIRSRSRKPMGASA